METTLKSILPQQAQLIEAKDGKGTEWEVAVIRAGLSGNATYYPAEVLQKAVPLFEGVRALARADEEHTQDMNRSVKNIVGWFNQPRFENDQISARFHISECAEWLRLLLLDAWRQGKKDIVGFSIVAQGSALKKKQGDEVVTYVESINQVFTVDVVLNPAAGGKVLKLVAGLPRPENHPQEDAGMQKLLQLLESKAPDLYRKIDPANASEDQVLNLVGTGQGETGLGLVEAQAVLREKLAEARLPELANARIEKRFFGQIFAPQQLNEAIREEREYLAKLSESGKVSGFGRVQVGDDEAHRLTSALDGFFANQDINRTPRFRSFREAYVQITGDANLTGQTREAKNLTRLAESLATSSWTEILGDSITRRMVKEYNMPGLQDWRKIVSDITAPRDFRSNRRMRVGGYGELPGVAENGAYQNLTSPGDEEATYSISKKGGLEEITLEMIANDDTGAIRRIPIRLARAAGNTLSRAVFNLIKDNVTIYDSVSLFHANHNNLGSGALDASSLLTGKMAMGKQTAYGASSEILGLTPRYLLAPFELQDTAYKLTTSGTMVGAPNNAGTEPNIHSSYGLEVIQVPFWTDTNDWSLICNPADCPTIEVGFYNGQEEPELFVQDQPNVGSLFSADKITYKIRFIYGVCVLDYRGMYKSVVA